MLHFIFSVKCLFVVITLCRGRVGGWEEREGEGEEGGEGKEGEGDVGGEEREGGRADGWTERRRKESHQTSMTTLGFRSKKVVPS